jgi:hypothetical protein
MQLSTLRRSVHTAVIGLALSGLALTACGGDDQGSADTTAASATTVAAASDTTAANGMTSDSTATDDTATDDTATDDTATDDESTTVDTSDIDPITTEECAALGDGFVGMFGSSDEDLDYQAIVDTLDALPAQVPDNLHDDAETVVTAFGTLLPILEKYDGDIEQASADPAYAEAGEALATPDVEAAIVRIGAYFQNCGDA